MAPSIRCSCFVWLKILCSLGVLACNTATRDATAPGVFAGGEDSGVSAAGSDSGVSLDGGGGEVTRVPPRSLVFVHLFEWKWTDIARECETFLGPKGFSAVQVSPPSEHAVLLGDPWWQRYQTVSYDVAKSRSGTKAEFQDMIARCSRQGVGIFVDAVINHMTAQDSGIGSSGTKYTKYEYPNLLTKMDFHSPICSIAGTDYKNSASNVQYCELLGLADLDTGAESVRDKIAGYLTSLVEMGVRGFRIDAAKHVAPAELDAILSKVNGSVPPNVVPYYFLEVIDHGGEAIHATDYLEVGRGNGAQVDVTEFRYAIGERFLGRDGHKLAELRTLDAAEWGLLPSDRAVVFSNNHDTQRADAIFYQDGTAHDLANVFMLAWPYGHVSIMSSFAFDRSTEAGRSAGPPSDRYGNTNSTYASPTATTPNCAPVPASAAPGTWVCEHRQRGVVNMVAFRTASEGAPIANWWDNGANQIAFARQGKGFVVINREPITLQRTFQTGLATGNYCDVLSGDFTPPNCSGRSIAVDAGGNAQVSVAPNSALAIHVDARL